MQVEKVNVSISTLANNGRTYLYNEMFSLAREHNCFYGSRFGSYFIEINNMPEKLLKELEEKKIKFMRVG